ncbi:MULTISPECIES: CheW domain-containing protein [unclassified Pseudomonas]|uniref:CheW domain-containing protein n=1 Tax=unclassified Pseudomonas TaxID=196821 RepID=UPI0008EFFB45|nr:MULTISPECIES: CheW domain-containing protein [unclassified Pseudomonas]PMV23425.1 chemotaxis protein CheW [Pseudomonas sp. FW305-3-2-15-C-TSA2]PMV31000.1 chemotaxis protein CheW [Pseudomonas sp. DP16D-L5]PMV39593.1 chemotaxis protein CheW [Pseudomonas sp. FW305-3-2-15-A-LB2]PMV45275.1 chemotaxis protein CheW [Pseudomonas sp. FW305-3-2-15-C-R2A1]PMV52243.1 chemotaxis protein CheW [Pseudomonas sp. FW305-3-2-15-C-LB1]
MNRPVELKTRPQLALESYLDALLQDATEEALPEPILVLEPAVEPEAALDEFQLAVLEEQARDAQVVVPIMPAVAIPAVVEPVVEVHLPPSITPPPVTGDDRPSWAAEPFECLLFDVAGLTLAVPLVCLGSIYSLEGQELTPLFGQPEWFLGILPSQAGNLKVLDTARWVMPDRYRDDFRQGLQYVISVQGYEWGLAVHQVSRSLRLDPNEIKWRSHRGQRPWLAGTVIEHMCALLDVAELAELIASGAVKTMPVTKRS